MLVPRPISKPKATTEKISSRDIDDQIKQTNKKKLLTKIKRDC